MTTATLDRPPPRAPAPPAERLRAETAGVRLSFTWLGVRRALRPEQKEAAAAALEASGDYVAASKKLLDTRHPALRAVGAVRRRATDLWKGFSLPYPEPGLRLVRRGDIALLDERFTALAAELAEAVGALEEQYDELRRQAQQRLGGLFDAGDYPPRVSDAFGMAWEFPSVEPPEYLMRLRPDLYERERRRVAARFDEAVELAEQAFLEEFGRLVAHLSERLEGGGDGRAKVFRDSALENLHAFFSRFERLGVSGDGALDRLVGQARELLSGVRPGALRARESLRCEVAEQLGRVGQQLDALMIDRPRRNLIRSPR